MKCGRLLAASIPALFSLAAHAGSEFSMPCRSVGTRVDTSTKAFAERIDCETSSGKLVHLLKLRGTYQENAYNQGFLLARESKRGLLTVLPHFIDHELGGDRTARALYSCLSHRVRRSAVAELVRGNEELIRGVRDGLGFQSYEEAELDPEVLQNAVMAVDTGIVLEGLKRRLQEANPLEKAAILADVASCLLKGHALNGHDSPVGQDEIERTIRKLSDGFAQLSEGTGFVVPSVFSASHSLIHARNLDGEMMEAFAAEPTLYLVAEAGRIDSGPHKGSAFHRFVSMGVAGMPYTGGISGFNDAGISVSIHEMQTTHYRTVHKAGTAEVGPYLQHRILREASSIDEAYEIVQRSGRVGAWSIFI
jgi:hypothetical protein